MHIDFSDNVWVQGEQVSSTGAANRRVEIQMRDANDQFVVDLAIASSLRFNWQDNRKQQLLGTQLLHLDVAMRQSRELY